MDQDPEPEGPEEVESERVEEPDTGNGDAADADSFGGVLRRLRERGAGGPRYTIEGEIARGGMGAILSVWDDALRRRLAMKVVLARGVGAQESASRGSTTHLASIDQIEPKTLGRFFEEAQVTGQLDHPGIVPVHDLGLDADGGVYFTMRLVRGRDLKQVFDLLHQKQEGWNPTRALGVMLKACEAMAYAHKKGVIHRDLKPANVMVGEFGEVYVMDWGLARVIGERDAHDLRLRPEAPTDDLRVAPTAASPVESDRHEGSSLQDDSPLYTMDGDIIGTPAYMSPEQAHGHISELDRRSDVYSVGAMLYQLLSGSMPYAPPGTKPSQFDVLMAVRERPPARLTDLNPEVPAELVAICEQAMAREPERRYADMLELAKDLRAYLEHRVVKAYATGAVAEFKKWVERNRALAGASATALLALLVGLVTSAVLYVRAERNAELARDRAEEARLSEELAEERRAEAELERVKVLRLSDVERLEILEGESAALWPAHPDRADDLRAWLSRADELADRLPLHRSALRELEAAALPRSDAERLSDRTSHPRFAELSRLEEHLTAHREGAEGVGGDLSAEELVTHVQDHERELSELDELLDERRTFAFRTTEEQWQHGVLAELVASLERFTSTEGGLLEDVNERLAFAETVVERTVEGPEAARLWDEAIASIADRGECPAYEGHSIAPQLGLLPIGRDPHSGLWEFALVQSGAVPERDETGELVLAEDMALVLVLIPGGAFRMGAQPTDEGGEHHHPAAQEHEGPVHPVEVGPFLLSKYEMTQGQWLRFTGTNPSAYKPGTGFLGVQRDLLHPVEQVSWEECERVLGWLDLTLPTEAQWEYAARAGTETAWWSGATREELQGVANIADGTAAKGGASWASIQEWPEFEDGGVVHARVATYAANGFGLHEIHGNVWEWCQDWFGSYEYELEEGTALRRVPPARYQVYRGGGFLHSASSARSSARDGNAPEYRGSSLGVRPARLLSPGPR